MEPVKQGAVLKLNRKTFLHDGVFVIQGTSVRVMEITQADGIIVQFQDREGFPHIIKGIRPEELEA